MRILLEPTGGRDRSQGKYAIINLKGEGTAEESVLSPLATVEPAMFDTVSPPSRVAVIEPARATAGEPVLQTA